MVYYLKYVVNCYQYCKVHAGYKVRQIQRELPVGTLGLKEGEAWLEAGEQAHKKTGRLDNNPTWEQDISSGEREKLAYKDSE